MSSEHVAGSKADKNRRRRSVASQFAHPMTGETMKERQVKVITETRKNERKLSGSSFVFFRTCKLFERSHFLSPFYFSFLYLSLVKKIYEVRKYLSIRDSQS